MVSVCFYFQVHQPLRLGKYKLFDIGYHKNYYNDKKNLEVLQKVANKCYIPANRLMYHLINEHPDFKISYSFSGVLLEQLQQNYPEALQSFQELVDTGNVELLAETYYHSLAFLYSKNEFDEQVALHRKKIKDLFGAKHNPKVFRNTELIYNNELAKHIENLGYKGILAEGADHILNWRSPNFVYRPIQTNNIRLLLKNYKLSDDIAFRFSSKDWKEYPLTAEKFGSWVSSVNGSGTNVNLFMDYETIGEHQWASTGIFNFLKNLPKEIKNHPDNNFATPSELIKKYQPVAELDVHNFVSWADVERDLSAWLGNNMQKLSVGHLYMMEQEIRDSGDKKLLEDWRRLQISDHFYYMCTKWFSDGDVHKYFNPYDRPHDSFISFINILNDMEIRLKKLKAEKANALSAPALNAPMLSAPRLGKQIFDRI